MHGKTSFVRKVFYCKIASMRRKNIILISIFILSFLLRFYRLAVLPPGLGRDEVSVAYNAYSILKTGHDEYGRFLPLYFEAIGDQKLPVIIYLSVPSIALFGLNEIGARFPFALLGSLTVVFLYLFLKSAAKLSPYISGKISTNKSFK